MERKVSWNFQVVLETIHVVLEIFTSPIFPGSFGKVLEKS
jgi:hypothetical protein